MALAPRMGKSLARGPPGEYNLLIPTQDIGERHEYSG